MTVAITTNAPGRAAARWPHERTVVGVVHDGRRTMVDAPISTAPAASTAAPGFTTTARTPALPWPSLGEHHVVLDTENARALVAVPFTAGEVPVLPDSDTRFDEIPGMRLLDHRGYWSTGLSFAPHGAHAASIEVHDDGCHLVLLDLSSGARRYLSALPGLTDAGVPLWSPDGHWLLAGDHARTYLVSTHADALIELDLGRPAAAATWWPQMGASTLMVLGGGPGAQTIETLDLATGARTHVADVESVPVRSGEPLMSSVWQPMMAPDGDRVLVGDTRGARASYQEDFGSARRLAVLDPHTGQVVPLASAFVAGSVVERVHSRWSWSVPQRPGERVHLAPAILADATAHDLTGRGTEPRTRCQTVWLWDSRSVAA